jgi:hypothetical protein
MASGKAVGWRLSGLAAAIRSIQAGMILFHKKYGESAEAVH